MPPADLSRSHTLGRMVEGPHPGSGRQRTGDVSAEMWRAGVASWGHVPHLAANPYLGLPLPLRATVLRAAKESTMTIQHINPNGMLKSPAFSQGIIVPAGARPLIIGGQNGVDAEGQLVSKDLGEQTAKAVDNLIKVLEAAGGALENLVRLGIYVKGDVDLRPGFEAWMQRWGGRPNPPTITVLRVAGLGMSPDALVEIEATAVLA